MKSVKNYGLNRDIIKNAEALMNTNEVNFENLLKSIYDDKVLIEKEKHSILELSKKQETLTKELELEKAKILDRSTLEIDKAKSQAREILLNAKDDASDLIKQMENVSNSKDLNNLRNTLNSKIKDLSIVDPITPAKKTNIVVSSDIYIDQVVFVKTYSSEGIITSKVSKSNTVYVTIGAMKVNVALSNIELIKQSSKNKKEPLDNLVTSTSTVSKSYTAKTEVNVIGTDSVTAVEIVDKFLDDCLLSNLNNVRIVHGKGSGILKKAIHAFLKPHPHIKSFRLGLYGEGESGVTIAELK